MRSSVAASRPLQTRICSVDWVPVVDMQRARAVCCFSLRVCCLLQAIMVAFLTLPHLYFSWSFNLTLSELIHPPPQQLCLPGPFRTCPPYDSTTEFLTLASFIAKIVYSVLDVLLFCSAILLVMGLRKRESVLVKPYVTTLNCFLNVNFFVLLTHLLFVDGWSWKLYCVVYSLALGLPFLMLVCARSLHFWMVMAETETERQEVELSHVTPAAPAAPAPPSVGPTASVSLQAPPPGFALVPIFIPPPGYEKATGYTLVSGGTTTAPEAQVKNTSVVFA